MKLGAYDFLPKPSKPDHILLVVRKALERKSLKDENRYLRYEIENQYQMVGGESTEIRILWIPFKKLVKAKQLCLFKGKLGQGNS